MKTMIARPSLPVLVALALALSVRPSALVAQGSGFDDSLLARVRALARATPGGRPRSLHVLKIVESAGPLNNYVAVPDSTRIASCYSVFQIRWRDRWIVVDAALDREMLGASSRAQFFQDRYDRLQLAMRDAEHVVLTHEHLDHAGGVERGPYFAQVAARTLLTEEQLRNLLDPQAPRGVIRLARDSAAAFPVLRYNVLFPLAPGVVLVKAPGHTPGSQFVYVQLSNGREILILGDLVWQHEGLDADAPKPAAASRSLGEDSGAVRMEMDWVRSFMARERLVLVLSHDSRSLDHLVAAHVLTNDFDLRRR
jgi:glyoxylase-like metal-dependent hydrolase (beta-lactamase superfamily II)